MNTPGNGSIAASPRRPAASVGRSVLPLGPEQVRLPEAVRFSGISRASLYREHAAGRIVFRKYGRATLVDVASLRALMAGLPTGVLRP